MIPYYEKYLSMPEITDNGIYIKVKCTRFSPNCPLSAWAKRHKSLRTAAIGVPTVFRLQPVSYQISTASLKPTVMRICTECTNRTQALRERILERVK